MGVTVRQKNIKYGDKAWWVFVSHLNRRTGLKVGSYNAAVDVQQKLQVVLALDRFFHVMKLRGRRSKTAVQLPKNYQQTQRLAENLRLRLARLMDDLDQLIERNRQ